MIAAGDVPDVFVTYGPGDPDSFERLAADGLLLPLTPYLERYPNLARRPEGREDQKFHSHFYALPVALPKSDHIGMIRRDWLDALGLPVPQAVDDLYRTARAFRQAYGIYPIYSSPARTAGFFWLNSLFHVFDGGWNTWLRSGDGSHLMCWVSERNRRGLQSMHGLYREGLLDPDAQKKDRFLPGSAGIVFHNGVS